MMNKHRQNKPITKNMTHTQKQILSVGPLVYGQKYVSINMVPKGGIEKSPAYKKLLTRCELDSKGRPLHPEKRDGVLAQIGLKYRGPTRFPDQGPDWAQGAWFCSDSEFSV